MLAPALPFRLFLQLSRFEEIFVFRPLHVATKRARAPLIPIRFIVEESDFFRLEPAAALLEPALKPPEKCVEIFSLFPFNFY